eukprot:7677635-Ditylum_brightwellii.AAC.1
MVALAIKAAEGKGLEATDTRNLTKLHLSTAKCVNTTRHMLNNLAAVAAELTGDTSILNTSLALWVDFINENEERLTDFGEEDHTFFTKIIYLVDSTKDQYLRHCRAGKIRREILDFTNTQRHIINRQFFLNLPPL